MVAYDITVYLVCLAVLIAILRDGKVSKAESYVLMVCCLVLGSTSLVTGFLPPLLNGFLMMVAQMLGLV